MRAPSLTSESAGVCVFQHQLELRAGERKRKGEKALNFSASRARESKQARESLGMSWRAQIFQKRLVEPARARCRGHSLTRQVREQARRLAQVRGLVLLARARHIEYGLSGLFIQKCLRVCVCSYKVSRLVQDARRAEKLKTRRPRSLCASGAWHAGAQLPSVSRRQAKG